MLKRLHIEQQQNMLTIEFEGKTLEVCAGETVAAAILADGAEYTRTTAISGAHRAPYCQMGICFECLMEIDGIPNCHGLAAAVTAGSFGLSVLVVDEQKDLGGQIYHSLENARPENRFALGEDYFYGEGLIRNFRNSEADYLPGTMVWNLDESGHIGILREDKAYQLKAKHLLIAAGAMERPVPIPGWTLPGVMGAAAADILFKVNDMVPDEPVVLAGSGPLQLLVACRLIDNGVKIAAGRFKGEISRFF